MKKLKIEIRELKVYCEKLNKEITINIKDCYWKGIEQECETCGSHGRVSVEFKCECGERHEVDLNSW